MTSDCCKEAICVTGRASPVTGPGGGSSATCEKSRGGKKTPHSSRSHNIIVYTSQQQKILYQFLLEMTYLFCGNTVAQFATLGLQHLSLGMS